MTVYFEFKDKKYPLEINYYESIKTFPDKFGINLGKIFTDEVAASETMQALIFDDERTIDLAWYFINEKTDMTFDDFLKKLTGKELEQFREDFWSAVVNFSPRLKQDLLRELWNQFKKDLKKVDLTNET